MVEQEGPNQGVDSSRERYERRTLRRKDAIEDPLALEIAWVFRETGVLIRTLDSSIGAENRIWRNAGVYVGTLHERIFGKTFGKDCLREMIEDIKNGRRKVSDVIKIIKDDRLIIPHSLLYGELESEDKLSLKGIINLAILSFFNKVKIRERAIKLLESDSIAMRLYRKYPEYFTPRPDKAE
jgi:signal recognition particle subunit SEC65